MKLPHAHISMWITVCSVTLGSFPMKLCRISLPFPLSNAYSVWFGFPLFLHSVLLCTRTFQRHVTWWINDQQIWVLKLRPVVVLLLWTNCFSLAFTVKRIQQINNKSKTTTFSPCRHILKDRFTILSLNNTGFTRSLRHQLSVEVMEGRGEKIHSLCSLQKRIQKIILS